MDDQTLILGHKNKFFVINLITHSKTIEFPSGRNDINSILCWNKNQLVIGQYDYIFHYSLDKSLNILHFLGSLSIKHGGIFKYPKSRLLIKTNDTKPKTLYLYG